MFLSIIFLMFEDVQMLPKIRKGSTNLSHATTINVLAKWACLFNLLFTDSAINL